MRAIVVESPGAPDVLQLKTDLPEPEVREGEVLVEVAAAGLNRADLLQRQGRYPPPPGASSLLGLECSGTIVQLGPGTQGQGWQVGDKVCALLAGGGYAEKVAVPVGQLLPVPRGLTMVEAAAVPEVACTVWSTIFLSCHLSKGETLLVHGGSSGIGVFAIQLAKFMGCRVFCTAGTPEKLSKCLELGAEVAINYRTEDFVERVMAETDRRGVDVILDNMGASYLQRNLTALAPDGRLFIIGFQGGASGAVDLSPMIAKRLTLASAGLRARTLEDKRRIVESVKEHVIPAIESGAIKVLVHEQLPLHKTAEAHRIMEESSHIGKVVLTCGL